MCFRESIHKVFDASSTNSSISQSVDPSSAAELGDMNSIDGNGDDDDDMNDEERQNADDIQNTLRLQNYIRGVGELPSADDYARLSRPSTSNSNDNAWA